MSLIDNPTDEELSRLPEPPCQGCTGACCKQQGPEYNYSVMLTPEDGDKFDDVAWWYDHPDGFYVRGLPYEDGKCVYLGDDNRCTIYEERPQICRRFNCLVGYRPEGLSEFLKRNSPVVTLIESLGLIQR